MSNLILKKFQAIDFDDYFRLVSNESVMKMITERAIPKKEALTNFQKILDQNQKSDPFGTYKVYNQTNEYIGLGSLKCKEENRDEAELGYMILPEHWGKGYGSEIAVILMQIAKKMNLKKVKAIIDPKNEASRKILLKQGFVSEKVCEIGGLPGEILRKTL